MGYVGRHADAVHAHRVDRCRLRALSAGGLDAVRVEPLARVLGVTKSGFYWQFDHRDGLLDATLERWEHMVIDDDRPSRG